jgi:hypothetical protein
MSASRSVRAWPFSASAARQVRGVDLHHRAHHDDLPVRLGAGQRVDQPEIHPLVDHAVEADARVRHPG